MPESERAGREEQQSRNGLGTRGIALPAEDGLVLREHPGRHAGHRRARHRSAAHGRITAQHGRENINARSGQIRLQADVGKGCDEVFPVLAEWNFAIQERGGIRRERAIAPGCGTATAFSQEKISIVSPEFPVLPENQALVDITRHSDTLRLTEGEAGRCVLRDGR